MPREDSTKAVEEILGSIVDAAFDLLVNCERHSNVDDDKTEKVETSLLSDSNKDFVDEKPISNKLKPIGKQKPNQLTKTNKLKPP